jgi:hypothetical protein
MLRPWVKLRSEQLAEATKGLVLVGLRAGLGAATGTVLELDTAFDAQTGTVWATKWLERLLNDDILADTLGQVKLVVLVDPRLVRVGIDVFGLTGHDVEAGEKLFP